MLIIQKTKKKEKEYKRIAEDTVINCKKDCAPIPRITVKKYVNCSWSKKRGIRTNNIATETCQDLVTVLTNGPAFWKRSYGSRSFNTD